METTGTRGLTHRTDATKSNASISSVGSRRPGYAMSYIAVCRSIDLCLICMVAWASVCMVVYGRRTNKWKLTTSARNVDGGKVYISCLLAVLLTFPRFVMSQIIFDVRILSSLGQCELLIDLTVVGYFVAVCPTYIFLWMRQRIIYGHPTIRAFIGRWTNVLSIATLPVLFLISLGGLCAFIIPESYVSGNSSCYEKPPGNGTDKTDKWDAMENYVIGGLNVISQLILLSLFIYPMIKVKKAGKRKQDKGLTSVIRRSVISASIAVVSDVLVAVLVAQTVPRDWPAVVGITFYDVNIVINVFCMMTTFDRVSDILLVFCKRKEVFSRRGSSRGSSTRNEETIKLEAFSHE